MQISPKKVATISYVLTLDSGEVADTATEEQPLAFIHGIGQTLEAFDGHLAGLAAGDEFNFKLAAKEGYGELVEEAIVDLPKDIFAEAPAEMLAVGNTVPMQDQEGNPLQGLIREIGDASVKVDFNHPLAGQALNFSGKVVDVREATQSELEHGHVHGPGGHEH